MATPLSPTDLQSYRQRLLDQLGQLDSQVEALQRDSLEPSGGTRFQDVDESIEETALSSNLDTLALEDESGYEIREALERLEQRTYGRCESCGQWISRPRLDLIPHTRLCETCAQLVS